MVSLDDQAALAILGRADALMVDVMDALSCLDRSEVGFRTLRLGIAANITVDLLSTYLRRHAYLAGVRLLVAKGSYDDLLGDVQRHQASGVDLLLILPFFDNLQPSWESQLQNLDPSSCQKVQADYLGRLELALQASQGIGQVVVLGAHLLYPHVASDGPQQRCLDAFNAGLVDVVCRHPQAKLVEMAGLLARHGHANSIDARFYFRGKAPYTAGIIDRMAREVVFATRGFGSIFHKVLVLDCDNTLWGGIVGEDGPDGIALDPYSFPGNIFWNVQQQLRALEARGVLLCLCSKNNPADVDGVLEHHSAMVLRDAHFVAKKINWTDKPTNLRTLAAELNLGLESFVFIDDSLFEIEAVREQLPQVTVFQVPKTLHDYPDLMREQVVPLFIAGGVSPESTSKTQQYLGLAKATGLQTGFASQEDYLQSLRLVVSLQRNMTAQVGRISELIAKSNQFNLTTQRLLPGEVLALIERADATVYSFSVNDRLAQHGLTGVLIILDEDDAVVVHSFLMSCRVIGRGIEFAIWRTVVADALARGKRLLRASFLPTAKNAQVADFYDRLGLKRIREASDGSRFYEASLADLALIDSVWVELRDV